MSSFDLGRSRSLEEYADMRDGVTVLQADSHSDEFQRLVREHGHFDLALIDGDHGEEGCRHDFELLETVLANKFLADLTEVPVTYEVHGSRVLLPPGD